MKKIIFGKNIQSVERMENGYNNEWYFISNGTIRNDKKHKRR